MKRLYWKIVLTVVAALAIVLSVSWVVMDISQDRRETRQMDELSATMGFFRLALQNGVGSDVSMKELESFAGRMLHSRVRISLADSAKSDVDDLEFRSDDRMPRGRHGDGWWEWGEGGRGGPVDMQKIHFKQGETPLVMTIVTQIDDRPRYELGFPLLATVAALVLFAVPLALWVSRPLQTLRRDMRRFASGDLDHRTKVSSKDEVGDLAQDFNQMAESIQRMIRAGKDLTANVSHELRSPLTRIDLSRQFLEEQVNGEQLIHLESMREEIEGMNGLIDRILRLSRLDLGNAKPESMCFAEMVRSVTNRHGASFEASGIGLKLDLPEVLKGKGVHDDLTCLVDNLLSNSLKFTPRKGSVSVSLRQRGNAVVMNVLNDAEQPAVAPERLLEPFQRGGVSESVPGSGLGLTIAKRIAESHGGNLVVAWANGRFTVHVELPHPLSS